MKSVEILQHISQNSKFLGSIIKETSRDPKTKKMGTTDCKIPGFLIDEAVKSHLAGKCRIGFRSADKLGKSNWFAIDFDHSSCHSKGLADFDGTLNASKQSADQLGLKYLEVHSRSGLGIHLWFLIDSSIDANQLRDVICAIVPDAYELGLDIFPKKQEGLPAAIYAPFFGKDNDQLEYDCLNKAETILKIVKANSGRYESGSSVKKATVQQTKKSNNHSSTKASNNGSKVATVTKGELDRIILNNEHRKVRKTIIEVNNKTHTGFDLSEQSLTYSTAIYSHFGIKHFIRKQVSIPTFLTIDEYRTMFQQKRNLSTTAFKTTSELHRYFEQVEDTYQKGEWQSVIKSNRNRHLLNAFDKRKKLTEVRRDQHLLLNCADASERDVYSTYSVYTTVEFVHKKKAIVHILMRDLLGIKGERYIAFSIPICNSQFIKNIRAGWKVYQLKVIEQDRKNQNQHRRFTFQVAIKPMNSKQKKHTVTMIDHPQYSIHLNNEIETRGFGNNSLHMDGSHDVQLANCGHGVGACKKQADAISNNYMKDKQYSRDAFNNATDYEDSTIHEDIILSR